MKFLILCLAALALAGCAYPTSSVEQGTDRGHFRFSDAPIGAELLIDGQSRGSRSGAEPLIIDIDPGKHTVEESSNGRLLFHADYDVAAGATVEVRSIK